MYKPILIAILLLFVALGTAWLITKPEVRESSREVVAPPTISPTPIPFVSSETGESIFVTFGTSTALLNGIGYSNILLTQVEAASGAKYESTDENLTLWNKEVEVTVTRGRKILFVGTSQDSLPLPVTENASSSATTSPTTNIRGSWLWVETLKGEQTIVPKDAGAFSITFSDGSFAGTTDCNNFSGAYTVRENDVSIDAIAMSKKFCEDSQEMEFTQQFIGTLTAVQTGNTLTLTHSDGTVNRFTIR
jgi:heat shock protein HslJ